MEALRRTHPLIIVAAGTVSLFSLVGIGAVMGWIPTSVGNQSNPSAVVAAPNNRREPAAKPVEHKARRARSENRAEASHGVAVAPPPRRRSWPPFAASAR
jgi:hypothetical protein